MKYKVALLSKRGGRKRNEDYATFLEYNNFCCYLVADGLGGHHGGEQASRAACEGVLEAFRESPGSSVNALKNYLEYACKTMEALRNKAGFNNALKTTLVVMLTGNNCATWAHIGDSRLYYFQSGVIKSQTKDHSVSQRLADIGEITYDQIRLHEDRSLLLRVLEGNDIKNFTLLNKEIPLNRGDAFLLCSDGFWEYVNENEMENLLQGSILPVEWLSGMENLLLSRAKYSHDNYSALAVMIT